MSYRACHPSRSLEISLVMAAHAGRYLAAIEDARRDESAWAEGFAAGRYFSMMEAAVAGLESVRELAYVAGRVRGVTP